MIRDLTLQFGKVPGAQPETIPLTPITVFVGPNNSGKSKVLAELHHRCLSGQKVSNDVILNKLTFTSFSDSSAEEKLRSITIKNYQRSGIPDDHVIVGDRHNRIQVHKSGILNLIKNPELNPIGYCQQFLKFDTLILNGANRIGLVAQQPAGDLQEHPQNTFQVLFQDDAKRHEIRRILYEAFGTYFVIDPTNLGQFRLRLSNRPPLSDEEERGITDTAIKFHSEALSIDYASDGVKAFTGIITEIIAGDPSVLLIDEPEAFLHPSLAFKLGAEVARATVGSEKRVFVSTHSPNFVMGCIQSGAPVNIIRLTYRAGVATARILPNDDLLKLMRNPLLRSTGVISGLFYEFVVVSEADSDRAFYQEINERLLRFDPKKGIPNFLFINAQNKQTVPTIIKPLRQLGIPAVGVVDIDILKEGGQPWSTAMDGIFSPDAERDSLAAMRTSIKKKFDESGKDMKRDGGIYLLESQDQEAASNLLDRLDKYGLFVVRSGELESWLKSLACAGHGPDWLVAIFGKMGENPENPDYVKPCDGDVWDFVGNLKGWLTNASRKGIPS